MLKKTLLKNTREFYEKNLPENLLLLKKSNKKHKKLLVLKGKLLKNKLLKFRAVKSAGFTTLASQSKARKNFVFSPCFTTQSKEKSFYVSSNKSNFNVSTFSGLNQVSHKVPFPQNFKPTLFSIHAIKSEFEKKQTKSSYFKNRLKEKKKLSILYGNLSNKEIKKNLEKAQKLNGSAKENLLLLLESRLDIILYRALFFPSIKFARHWIKTNKILVNSQSVTIPSYKAQFGDIISITSKNKRFIGNNILKFLSYYNFVNNNSNISNQEKMIQPWTIFNHKIHALVGKKLQKLNKKVNSQKNAVIWSIFSNFSFLPLKKNLFSRCLATQGLATFIFPFSLQGKKWYFNTNNTLFSINHEKKITNLKPAMGYTYLETTPIFLCLKQGGKQVLQNSIANFRSKNTVFLPINTTTCCLNSYFSFLNFFRFFRHFAAQSLTQKTHETVSNLLFAKQKIITLLSKKFKQKKNVFREKHRYIISNFYFTQLQNQIKPINTFFTEQSVNKLQQNSVLNREINIKQIDTFSVKTNQQAHQNNFSTSKKVLFLNTLLYKKSIIYLACVHKNIISETKKIGSLILGNKFIYDQEKQTLMHALKKYVSVKHYDMLTFLKLKSVFFKKKQHNGTVKNYSRSSFSETQVKNFLPFFRKKINYKPLNLEISYKTLTIIYLYPSQKLLFPCTLDIELLVKKKSNI